MRNQKRGGVFVGLSLAAALLLMVAGCAVPLMPAGQERVQQLSAAQQQALGQRVYRQFVQQSGGVYPDREVAAYVDRIGQILAAADRGAGSGYRFEVLNDSTPSTLALPGGFIAVSRGLLAMLQTEAQLAAVLAGELGHLVARHPLPGGGPVPLNDDPASAGDYAAMATALAQLQGGLSDGAYSIEQELEADRIAVELLVAAGYPPSAAVDVQEMMLIYSERHADNDGPGRPLGAQRYSAQRLEQLRNDLAERDPDPGGRIETGDFPLLVRKLQQVEEGYALYDQARHLERQGQAASAIETYHQALLAAPDQSLILTGLGLAYLRNEDPVPARRYLLKAVNLDGDYAQSRLGLGYVYLQKWQYAQAISQLEKSLQLLPTVEAAFLLAEAQQQIGQQLKARELYRIVTGADRDGRLGQLAANRLAQLQGN